MNSNNPLPGVPAIAKPKFCCIIANPGLGYGVYSMHMKKEEADFNANLLDGVALPLDYAENGNVLIMPPLAMAVMRGKPLKRKKNA